MALTQLEPAARHQRRIETLVGQMRDQGLNAAVLFDPANILYLVGYWTILSPMFLQACVVTESAVHLIIPALEEGAAEALPVPVRLTGYRNYPLRHGHVDAPARQYSKALDDVLVDTGASVIGADLESARAPAAAILARRSQSPPRDMGPTLRRMRAEKDPLELSLVQRGAEIAVTAVLDARGSIAAGVPETVVAAQIAWSIWSSGAIPTHIVLGSGPRSALAHPEPTERKMEAGELVLIDIGLLHRGYWAEIARTYAVTDPTRHQETWHAAVREAQAAAASMLRPGARASAVDRAARDVLAAHGYDGVHFNHAAGHGLGVLGMDAPSIAPESQDIIPQRCAVTLEPAVYFKGLGGVRIEDTFLASGSGVKSLTALAPRSLNHREQ